MTAIDNNEHALTQLQYLAAALNVDKNINIINSDILTPIGDELFDFVVCNMVLHYASDESSAVEIVKNVQKATKIGGVNYFSTFTDSNMYGTRSCLLPDNRLAELYPDWLITDYDLRPSTTVINVDGREVNHFICSIVAFKIR